MTAFVCNSINAAKENELLPDSKLVETMLKNGPPFPVRSFHRILLDAPCSGLGQRPKLEPVDLKHTASFPPLQKKLFQSVCRILR